MSFVLNDASMQQMSFLDSYNTLTEREKKFLEKSWAKYFAEHIFPKIDERPYAVLYSGKDSRPNTPVNIQIGALIIKEINFPGASTQTPQGCLPPASQERGIRPNLATLGASLRDAEHRGMYPPMIQGA